VCTVRSKLCAAGELHCAEALKSVSEGVVSPSMMETALPTRLFSGRWWPVPWMAKLYGVFIRVVVGRGQRGVRFRLSLG